MIHLVMGSSQTHNLSGDGHRLRSKVYIDYHTIMVTTSVGNQNLSKFKDQLCYLKSKLVAKFSLVEVLMNVHDLYKKNKIVKYFI